MLRSVLKWFGLLCLVALAYLLWLFRAEMTEGVERFMLERRITNALQHHNTQEAILLLGQGVQRFPKEPLFHLRLAYQYQALRKLWAAKQQYELGLQQDPSAYSHRHAYAKLLLVLKQPNAAVRQYQHVLWWKPNYTPALTDLGQFYLNAYEQAFNRNHAKEAPWLLRWALYYYGKAVQQQPKAPKALYGLAYVYQLLEEPTKASHHYCQFLKLQPLFWPARYNLGLMLERVGKPDLGQPLLAWALQYRKFKKGTDSTLLKLYEQMSAVRNQQWREQGGMVPYAQVSEEELAALEALSVASAAGSGAKAGDPQWFGGYADALLQTACEQGPPPTSATPEPQKPSPAAANNPTQPA
jgi:Tfp pilus assembly protein PilF